VAPVFFEPDPPNPARGIACAMLLSGVIWLAIIAAFLAA
jgi:hypothetical protein